MPDVGALRVVDVGHHPFPAADAAPLIDEYSASRRSVDDVVGYRASNGPGPGLFRATVG